MTLSRKALDENGIPLIVIKTNDLADLDQIESRIEKILYTTRQVGF